MNFQQVIFTGVTLPHRFTGMSRYDWNNPPPPGTEYEGPEASSSVHSQIDLDQLEGIKQIEPSFSQALQCLAEERAVSSEKTGLRSRSRSHERRRRRKRSRSYSRRSRSYSRSRRRRSRSHSRRRRRKYSSSRSRSRSPEYRHRQRRRPRHRSRSRSYGSRKKSYKSRSNSRSHSISKSFRSERERKSSKYDYTAHRKRGEDFDGDLVDEDIRREDSEEDVGADSQPESDHAPIPFKNDGSFLEMFKKMQEEQKVKEEPSEETVPKKPVFGAFGKRRGGKVLKTGMVAKVRNVEEEANSAQDAWSVYMQEVRKYKEVHCDDDSKTRPLVK
ncbi:hypothetical protein HUJ04_008634 [Dendroctonus ponderosae]|nr:hypothetical protein HUJ04_008634 [Dendroctonus ponderosae]